MIARIGLVVCLFLTGFGAAAQNVRWIKPGGVPSKAAVAGNYLVTSSGGGSMLQVWDRNTLQFIKTLPGDEYGIWSLEMSRDGSTAVTIGDSQNTTAWNIANSTKQEVYFNRFTFPFYQSGSNHVINFTYHRAYVFDLNSGQNSGVVENWEPNAGMVFSPDGKTYAIPHQEGVTIREIATGEERVLRPRVPGAHPFKYSPDGLSLAMDLHASDTDTNLNSVVFWGVYTGAIRKTLVGADGRLGMAFRDDHLRFATLDINQDLTIWNMLSDEAALTFRGPFTGPFLFISNDKMMVSGKILDLNTGQLTELTSGQGVANGLQFSASGRYLATDERVFDAATGAVISTLDHARIDPTAAAAAGPSPERAALTIMPVMRWNVPIHFLNRETQVAVGNEVFEVATGNWARNLAPPSVTAFGADWYLTSEYGTGSENIGTLRRYADGSVIRGLDDGGLRDHRSATVSPSQGLIATAGAFATQYSDSIIRIWNAATGELVRRMEEPLQNVYDLEFSADERLVGAISNAGDLSYGVWDVETGRRLFGTGAIYGTRVGAFALLPQDLLLWPRDGALEVRDVRAGTSVAMLKNELYLIGNLAVSPDGTKIAAVRQDGTVLVVDAPVMDRLVLNTASAIPTIRFFARPNVVYVLESSGDLRAWNEVARVTGAGSTYERPINTEATTFYRLR